MESIFLNSVAGLEVGRGRGALHPLQILEKVGIGLGRILCAVNNYGGAAGGAVLMAELLCAEGYILPR